MSPFLTVRVRAMNNLLCANARAHAHYLASEEFLKRIDLEGPQGHSDRVAIVLYMLDCVALSPRDLSMSEVFLAAGCVHLQFFGVSNPVPIFSVSIGSVEHKKITEAVYANKTSRMFSAAVRLRKHRETDKVRAYSRMENAQMDMAGSKLHWPSSKSDFSDEAVVRDTHKSNQMVLDERIRAIRDLRHRRLAGIASTAAPGARNWTQFIEDAAVNVFCRQRFT